MGNETHGVSKVIDGDTFVLNNQTVIRMYGIDAPDEGERNFAKSRDFLKSLLPENKQVFLEIKVLSLGFL